MKLRRLIAVARKEWLHIVRDPRSLWLALAVPVMLLLLFGYALTLDVDRIPTMIYDQNRTPQSDDLAARFRGSRFFDVKGVSSSFAPIARGIDDGQLRMGIVISKDYAQHLMTGQAADVQVIVDGSDSNTASIALGYAVALLEVYNMELRIEGQNMKGGSKLKVPVEGRVRVWYNSELKSRNYIVPGLIAVILMIISALLTSLTIAREYESGTLEQLLSTPVRPAELVLGKLSAYFAIGLADMFIAITVGVMVFGVPMRGNHLFLFVSCCIFLFGALAWGVLLSALMRSQLLAFQAGLVSSFLPAFLLSGFVYSISNMPVVIQAVTYIVPSRYFVSIAKGIFLKGVGVQALWWEVLLLTAYAVIVFLLATRKMRQKLA